MLRTVGTYIYAAFLVIGTVFNLQKSKKLVAKKQTNDEQLFVEPKHVSRKVIEYTGTDVHVKGQEKIPDGAVLYVANHQGLFDILTILGYLGKPVGFIAKKEIKRLPIISTWMELIHCVFIDRADRRQSIRAIQQGTNNLKNGHSMVIFPEGTRGEGREINEFKAGSFRLGTKANVPIVPLAIDGTYPILEANGGRIKSSTISLTILDPIYPEKYNEWKSKELAVKVQEEVEANLLEIQQRAPQEIY
ncbi:lysophospholipid acyltransferase family protein [Oceanobacillus halophilus]|uniref:1-acyl-sn-glycerol-3-phosphate acyltransferase n=1 Tax=Oceanobacillus halophilus TaxID=930130 RepID=A0A494ZXE1_9BACI|nr:lysophospholipid acyltransferase family protein [Oceanobacillus halophilus]RKQ31369.1 1-acyl-sn-glycerol-3-phosphate acyltransferase [Oceanobacillus halophilus]